MKLKIVEDVDLEWDNYLKKLPKWCIPYIEKYKPLKKNAKRVQDIDDIMELYACRYGDCQKIIDEFRGVLYYELSQVSNSQVPHSHEEKMNYTKTRWANFLLQIEVSK